MAAQVLTSMATAYENGLLGLEKDKSKADEYTEKFLEVRKVTKEKRKEMLREFGASGDIDS